MKIFLSQFFKKNNIMQKGFTLIELLVVVAIIGVLATIVLSSLSAARTRARHARFVSNMENYTKLVELQYFENGAYPVHSNAFVYLSRSNTNGPTYREPGFAILSSYTNSPSTQTSYANLLGMDLIQFYKDAQLPNNAVLLYLTPTESYTDCTVSETPGDYFNVALTVPTGFDLEVSGKESIIIGNGLKMYCFGQFNDVG